jgi:hypothetical protein
MGVLGVLKGSLQGSCRVSSLGTGTYPVTEGSSNGGIWGRLYDRSETPNVGSRRQKWYPN